MKEQKLGKELSRMRFHCSTFQKFMRNTRIGLRSMIQKKF